MTHMAYIMSASETPSRGSSVGRKQDRAAVLAKLSVHLPRCVCDEPSSPSTLGLEPGQPSPGKAPWHRFGPGETVATDQPPHRASDVKAGLYSRPCERPLGPIPVGRPVTCQMASAPIW